MTTAAAQKQLQQQHQNPHMEENNVKNTTTTTTHYVNTSTGGVINITVKKLGGSESLFVLEDPEGVVHKGSTPATTTTGQEDNDSATVFSFSSSDDDHNENENDEHDSCCLSSSLSLSSSSHTSTTNRTTNRTVHFNLSANEYHNAAAAAWKLTLPLSSTQQHATTTTATTTGGNKMNNDNDNNNINIKEDIWYTFKELRQMKQNVVSQQASNLIRRNTDRRAMERWRTLDYFYTVCSITENSPKNATTADATVSTKNNNNNKGVTEMKRLLGLAYAEVEEMIGLERILLNWLHQVDTGPSLQRRQALFFISQHDPTKDADDIAKFQKQLSRPYRLFARETAQAQARAIALDDSKAT
eukprot:CAMPEP_0198154358 /NCGR_PEP_ID=MMETSP1443-20131203/68385_1 /TAXON_ID=186043 /ORGANISM="Entomoneis sp., Strain CCMP2396" /LENGTH=356 /DNA_ID=CAMNT_0043821019 /DNA_START=75 /DNA_END=1142 /DNA_ORIENTATION=-